MYIRRNFTLGGVLIFAGGHLIWLTLWATFAYVLYTYLGFDWLTIPWLPVSLIGIAVAFYVGFKNNSAYDRNWEARKIWGGIVNDSRSFAIAAKHYVTNKFRDTPMDEEEIKQISSRLIHRHIAWLYTLRHQLLKSTPWEHINASRMIRLVAQRRQQNWGKGLFEQDPIEKIHEDNLGKEDQERLKNVNNQATHLLDMQAEDLKRLRDDNTVDDFRHMDFHQILYKFYELQGKCERIKNYPLPRQYASMSFVFVGIFIVLLPFGLMPEFADMGENKVWLAIPFTVLSGWVFILMELVGDYTENPFEGMGNDIPMLSLCRTIEIDLRQLLDEKDIPPKIEAVNHVVM